MKRMAEIEDSDLAGPAHFVGAHAPVQAMGSSGPRRRYHPQAASWSDRPWCYPPGMSRQDSRSPGVTKCEKPISKTDHFLYSNLFGVRSLIGAELCLSSHFPPSPILRVRTVCAPLAWEL